MAKIDALQRVLLGGQLDPGGVTSVALNVVGLAVNMVFRCRTVC